MGVMLFVVAEKKKKILGGLGVSEPFVPIK
jgi:hypothetical protein